MRINELKKVQINGLEQWVLVRGNSPEAPLLIQVQAGPGFPMIPEANAMEKKLQWEDEYLIAYWDQRGCGKSYNNQIDPQTMNFAQLADDVLAMTEYLLQKYKKERAVLVGYSLGATIGLMAVSKNNSLFSRLFLVGIDIDVPVANKYVMEFALTKASERNNERALKDAKEISGLKITNSKSFQRRAKLVGNMGGIMVNSNYNKLLIGTIRNMLFSKAYRLLDIPKTIKGMEFCQDTLLPEMDRLNLFNHEMNIDIPVHFIQGKKDAVAPEHIARKYFDYLPAKEKAYHTFENSAHLPHLEEPGKFMGIMRL